MLNEKRTTVNPHIIGGIAQIANVALCHEAIKRTKNRTQSLPGLAAFYAPSGFGKSISANFVATRHNAYYVQAKSSDSKKSFANSILNEMRIPAQRTLHQMIDQISTELAQSGKPLIIDEFDHLVEGSKVELVRDIYEGSQGTILIIGEELLPTKLERWERFHARIMNWIPALPASPEDAALLAQIYAPNITVDSAVLEELVSIVRGSTRRVSPIVSTFTPVHVLR